MTTILEKALPFAPYGAMSDEQAQERILAARAQLGEEAVILCHHYQRADVYRHSDLTGDSLKLARLAAQTSSRYIVFCGVHFMAEVADILSQPEQVAILPDLAAGCSMADMADLAKVTRAWRELGEVLDGDPAEVYTPVTYINSAADLKAFCGRHGGIVCTSTNAPHIMEWALARRPKLLFFPDQHLGRWTGHQRGIPLEDMLVWDPDLPYGGLSPEQIRRATILLWKGHCSVHQMLPRRRSSAGAPGIPRATSSRTRSAPSRCASPPITSVRPNSSRARCARRRPAPNGWWAPSSTW